MKWHLVMPCYANMTSFHRGCHVWFDGVSTLSVCRESNLSSHKLLEIRETNTSFTLRQWHGKNLLLVSIMSVWMGQHSTSYPGMTLYRTRVLHRSDIAWLCFKMFNMDHIYNIYFRVFSRDEKAWQFHIAFIVTKMIPVIIIITVLVKCDENVQWILI